MCSVKRGTIEGAHAGTGGVLGRDRAGTERAGDKQQEKAAEHKGECPFETIYLTPKVCAERTVQT